jgi:hypothetical protein
MINKSSKLILATILAAFFFRGLFLIAVFPIFKGQDESRHYNTIQYLATKKSKDCLMYESESKQIKRDLSTYRYSDEIRETALVSQTQQIRGKAYDKIKFTKGADGLGERDFKKTKPSKTQHICPPDVANNALLKDDFSIYHKSLVGTEILFKNNNIFIRYYVLRIISVLLGVVMLFLAYNIFKAVNLSNKQSLILTTIISFQPKLSIYFTNINYDALLIPLWTASILLGVLILKKGWNFWRTATFFIVLWLAVLTKPSALAMLGMVIYLLVYKIYQEMKERNKNGKIKIWQILLVTGIIFFGGFLMYPSLEKIGIFNLTMDKYTQSIGEYINKSFSKIYGSSRDYWGGLGWKANNLTIWYIRIIWLTEYVAWGGLVFWQIARVKKIKQLLNKAISHFGINKEKIIFGKQYRKFFKEHAKYFYFSLVAIISLQMGIHIADWKMFVETGSLSLGTPGRYWLPNIVPHFVLLAFGLKIVAHLFRSTKIKRKYFDLSLLAFMILMILYWSYEVFDIIIPRFYL